MANSALLNLAESYYAVSRHLAENGKHQIEVAEMLADCADRMCAQNIRESDKPAGASSEASPTGSTSEPQDAGK